MHLFKKNEELFRRQLQEIGDVGNMLQKEGQSDGERRYKIIVAEQLAVIVNLLLTIRTVLFALLGFIIGKLLSSLF